MKRNHDRKMVSHKQYWEPRYIASRFEGCTIAIVKEAAEIININKGKKGLSRSRGEIYAKLKDWGHKLKPTKPRKK